LAKVAGGELVGDHEMVMMTMTKKGAPLLARTTVAVDEAAAKTVP
jgi:hypothetical protein